jgi:plastocyanin
MTAACGSSSGSGSPAAPTAPSAPAPPATVTITASGVSPREVTIAVGGRVTFVNNDAIPHDVAGGPDPANPDCREIDAVGFLTPGQTRQTAPLPTARTCEYHDHGFHSALFNGRIVIR